MCSGSSWKLLQLNFLSCTFLLAFFLNLYVMTTLAHNFIKPRFKAVSKNIIVCFEGCGRFNSNTIPSVTLLSTSASKLFPQPGSDDWGKGCVLVITQDGQLVEKPNEYVMEYHLNDGMSEHDAMSFIQTLTGRTGDTKARELVNKLHRLPLGISV